MSRAAQLTTWQNDIRGGNLGSPDADSVVPAPVQNLDESVALVVEHRTAALTKTVVDQDKEAATLTAFRGYEEEEHGFSLREFLRPSPPPPRPATTLHALQEWEGYVLEIRTTDFVAHLVDLKVGASHEKEEAVIPLAEISDYDVNRMRTGSIFRWVIGYERSIAGTKKRVSQIVFRDLPAITEADLKDGEAWAHETIQSLNL